jgi:DNA-binding NarL/FixJ family response regulator
MKLFLADSGTSTRFALSALLEQQTGWTVVGEVSSGDQLIPDLDSAKPDVLLIEWNLAGGRGEDMIPAIKERYPAVAVIVLSGRPELRGKACSVGADAFVSKTEPPEKLLGVISTFSSRVVT